MTLNLRLFYLPPEFTNVYVTMTYIPPSANYTQAQAQAMRQHVNKLLEDRPNSLIIIMGDTNKCAIKNSLDSSFTQYVMCTTRKEAILDVLLCNVKQAYRCKNMSPLGSSHHNI